MSCCNSKWVALDTPIPRPLMAIVGLVSSVQPLRGRLSPGNRLFLNCICGLGRAAVLFHCMFIRRVYVPSPPTGPGSRLAGVMGLKRLGAAGSGKLLRKFMICVCICAPVMSGQTWIVAGWPGRRGSPSKLNPTLNGSGANPGAIILNPGSGSEEPFPTSRSISAWVYTLRKVNSKSPLVLTVGGGIGLIGWIFSVPMAPFTIRRLGRGLETIWLLFSPVS